MEEVSLQLFSTPVDAKNYRSIRLDSRADGTLCMSGHEMGPAVEEWWGDDDYEYWVILDAANCKRLLMHMLQDKFTGQENAVGEFRDYLNKAGISFEFGSWI